MTAIFGYEYFLNGDVDTTVRSQALRLDTEDGIPIQLKRFEKRLLNQPAQYLLTPAQRVTFENTWYPASGHDWFDYVNPNDGATVQGRIIGGDYRISPCNHTHGRYLLTFQVEFQV